MPKSWDEWASMIGIVTVCVSFIVWISNVWIIGPLTKSLNTLSIKIDGIGANGDRIHKAHDEKLDEHDRRLDRHHERIKDLRTDVDELQHRRSGRI